jgi:hypothetical protein
MTDYPYEGEVQLLGYAWNPDDGPWIRIRLDEIAEMAGGPHPFNGLKKGREKGQRMKMRFDLIADDETTTAEQPAEPVKGGARARRAGILCNEPAFHAWAGFTSDRYSNEDNAAYWVCARCSVESRAELDHNEEAGRIWDQIERDYRDAQAGITGPDLERQANR